MSTVLPKSFKSSVKENGSTSSFCTIQTFSSKSLSKTGERYYLSDEMADVYFTFDNERVPGHKLFLSASTVFNTMFNGAWKEDEEVKIIDASVSAFKEFLQFFYLNEPEVTMENVAEMMNLGNKYNIIDCMDACCKLLILKHNTKNACLGLDIALLFNRTDVKDICEETIKSKTNKILMTPDFMHCDKRVLSYIVKEMDVLDCSETELFVAGMSWIEARTGQTNLTRAIVDNEIGDLFYEFRFGSCTIKDFADMTIWYGYLFTSDDYQNIIRLIAFDLFHGKFSRKLRRSYV